MSKEDLLGHGDEPSVELTAGSILVAVGTSNSRTTHSEDVGDLIRTMKARSSFAGHGRACVEKNEESVTNVFIN
jgi:hypothetical protein